jgi:hypothetical protein
MKNFRKKRSISFDFPRVEDHEEHAKIDLVDIVRSADSKPDVSRVGSDLIHVSSVIGDFCPRREWLKREIGYYVPHSVSGAMRIVWALGRSAEHHVREQLLTTLRGNAFGRWGCTRCAAEDEDARQYHFKQCECGGTFDRYIEAEIVDEETQVTGSVDFVWIHRDSFNFVEIKSMNKKDFDLLKKVKADHMNQVEYYRWLFHRNGFKVNRAEVIVVAKDFVMGSPYKLFRSERVATAQPMIVGATKDDVELSRGDEMPKRIQQCASPEAPRAKVCEACSLCFNMSSE